MCEKERERMRLSCFSQARLGGGLVGPATTPLAFSPLVSYGVSCALFCGYFDERRRSAAVQCGRIDESTKTAAPAAVSASASPASQLNS
ncbi:hypothetical protein HPB50_003530 [Hyalomma asiaticum]|uniref:Uncharacterized protein n=1 Tax=Hyalomma asiaticum TaxID=266040 RepID=A0ACB7RU42_HYAAI|nr:hypothetical protein HPB50_003530 [Hyalomma asiaticum]